MTDPQLIALAVAAAKAHDLDPALVCAVVEQESGWNPWAIRYEPAFMSKYVAPLYTKGAITATEAYARSFSWGLAQIMGQVAREKGFANTYLASLLDPATNLEWGCLHLKGRIERANGDIQQGLQYWNGGSNPNYANEVLVRVPKYQAILAQSAGA